MLAARAGFVVLLFCGVLGASPSAEPLNSVADYYVSRYSFKQAGALYAEVLAKQPDNLRAALHLSDTQLIQEGRPAARETLSKFLRSQQDHLTREQKKQIKEKWAALQSFFLTDQAQTFFLQGVAKKERKDCEGAVPLFQQAASLEAGNLQILREKAACEQSLGSFDHLYETLQSLHEADPFDVEFAERLAESFVYFRDYRRAGELLKQDPDFVQSVRGRTAYAVALAGQGMQEEAIRTLTELKSSEPTPPIVWFQLGLLLSRKEASHSEGVAALRKFLNVYSPKNVPVWDPYRLEECASEARRLVAVRAK